MTAPEEKELRALWAASFDDSPAYIDFFMKNRPKSVAPVTVLRDGRIAGGAWGFPCAVRGFGPAVYGYAAATRPDLRGGGIATALLRGWGARLRAAGTLLCVLAEDDALIPFYQKLGFSQLPSRRRVRCAAAGADLPLRVADAGDAEYRDLRDAYFSWDGCLRWDLPCVRYALRETRFSGGFAHTLTIDGHDYLLRGEKRGARLRVFETTMDDAALTRCAGAICRRYGVGGLDCLLPAQSALPGETERTAFVYGDVPDGLESLWICFTMD